MGAAMLDRFSESYAQARERFLKLVRNHGNSARTYVEPGSGPDGEELATDVAWFGDPRAEAVMVMTSATHGVEGFCGSAAQLDFLMNGGAANLPDNTAALLVQAINPYGFAWLRRVTQEGVDLNRNSVDFNDPPQNPEYARLSDVFRPKRPGSAEAAESEAVLAKYRAEVGEAAFAEVRSAGQYVDPQGIFYGGSGPTWSRSTMQQFIADFDLRARKQVGVIDYHTGLGPHGYGEPICGSRPSEPGAARAYRSTNGSTPSSSVTRRNRASRPRRSPMSAPGICAPRSSARKIYTPRTSARCMSGSTTLPGASTRWRTATRRPMRRTAAAAKPTGLPS